MREVREEVFFELRLDLPELALELSFVREEAALEADAEAAEVFFFAAAAGVSPEPLSAASVPTGGRTQTRQSRESRNLRDIAETSGARTGHLRAVEPVEHYSTTLRPQAE